MIALTEVPKFPRMRGRQSPPVFLAGLVAFALVVAACEAPPPTAATPEVKPELAVQEAGDLIPGRFIVTVRAGFDPRGVAAAHGVSPTYVYTHALNGFAGEIREAARSGLMRDARVVRIEQDHWAFPDGLQADPPWHLDRVDQRILPMDGYYSFNRTGQGVTVYIIDSGIRFSHQEFGGRASNGYDFVWHDPNASPAEKGEAEGEDCRKVSGHGTSVAAMAGGNTVGVARDVSLVSVRIFGCEDPAPASRTIAAVDWVTAHHEKPAVANMSLGHGASESMDDAVRNSIAAGVTYTVSAGNRGNDRPPRLQLACNQSPARVRQALTAAATDHLDRKPSWSSYGECVDLFAPGEGITTATRTADDAYREDRFGTSFSAPLVAGVAALYLQERPTALPAEVFAAVIDATTKNIVTSAGSGTTNNHLLFSLAWGEVTPPVQHTITASAAEGGTINPSGEVVVNEGASQTFSIAANEDFQISDVEVDGFSVGAVSSYTFEDVTDDHTIHATFAPVPTYTITASAGEGGTINPSGEVVVNEGANQTFSITASDGYQISEVVVDDASVGPVSSYTFTNVTADHTIHATFEEATSEPPSINQFHLTNTSNPQFARVRVDWAVSGQDLKTVTVTIAGPNSDSRTWNLSGSEASGQHEFSFRRGFGTYDVTLTVTDASGGWTSETKQITL